MCGIVGYIGRHATRLPILIEGLHRLEYRGYDSAGIAVVTRRRAATGPQGKGKVRELEGDCCRRRFKGTPGIAHTRWATHGEPSDAQRPSAHRRTAASRSSTTASSRTPRRCARELERTGVVFRSETDTRGARASDRGDAGGDARRGGARRRCGWSRAPTAIAVIDARRPDAIVAARNGSPVVLGIGEQRDVRRLRRRGAGAPHPQVVYLDDGEVAVVDADGFETATLDGGPTGEEPVARSLERSEAFDKGEHAHFMRKEIVEQPEACAARLSGRLEPRFRRPRISGGIELAARELLESAASRSSAAARPTIAGARRRASDRAARAAARRMPSRPPSSATATRSSRRDTLYIAVSQSGETFDTLAAVQEVKRKGGRVLGIVNVVGSTHRARSAAAASTSTPGPRSRWPRPRPSPARLSRSRCSRCTSAASAISRPPTRPAAASPPCGSCPIRSRASCARRARCARLARSSSPCAQRVISSAAPPAMRWRMEGALKLKEVSYLHAEAYPAAELKHGPLALISPETPTVVVDAARRPVREERSPRSRRSARDTGRSLPSPTPARALPGMVDDAFVVPPTEPELDPMLLDDARCSCSPITSPWSGAATSTSRAIWPRA